MQPAGRGDLGVIPERPPGGSIANPKGRTQKKGCRSGAWDASHDVARRDGRVDAECDLHCERRRRRQVGDHVPERPALRGRIEQDHRAILSPDFRSIRKQQGVASDTRETDLQCSEQHAGRRRRANNNDPGVRPARWIRSFVVDQQPVGRRQREPQLSSKLCQRARRRSSAVGTCTRKGGGWCYRFSTGAVRATDAQGQEIQHCTYGVGNPGLS